MIARLIRRFVRDERGVFAVTFGLMAIVLVAMAGAVVDYIQVDQVRSRTQIALDAAALALQPEIYTKSEEQLKITAQALLSERISDPGIKALITSVDTEPNDGQLYLRADVTVPMSFVSLVGIDEMTTPVVSQVTRKRLRIEASFVLDNSGSMGGTKIASLKTAATTAINILFYGTSSPGWGATKSPNTKVAVVPFTFFVNAGSGFRNATWVDRTGDSVIATDNLDDDNDDSIKTITGIDRIGLMDSLNGSAYDWKGCFEARPYPYNVDDTPPSAADPDTLFVPEFAPDEPGPAGRPDGGFNNSYVDDSPSWCSKTATCTCQTTYGWCGSGWHRYWCSKTSCTVPDGTSCSCNWGANSCNYSYTPTNLSNREKQERICKYAGATVVEAYDSDWHEPYTQGPNAGCPDADIQPLTDDVTSLTTKINAMVADGGTNIQEGTTWGLRTLSPTEPFTEGNEYDSGTFKVLIIMTDGDNTYWHINRRHESWATPNMNGTYYYMPYGYQYNDRLTMHPGSTNYQNADGDQLQIEMNKLTLRACQEAKDAGITVYTVGLGTTKPSENDTADPWTKTGLMLRACATDPKKARFPSQASQLEAVFAGIAEELSELRIER